jgi:hypothetical protein
MSKSKDRFSCSLDQDIISSISEVAAKKGQKISYVVTSYMRAGLSKEVELTATERYTWAMTRVSETIDRMFKIAKITNFNGNTKEAMLLLSSLLILDKGYFESDTAYDTFRLSFFEVLSDIAEIDKPLINDLTVILEAIQKKLKSSENSEGFIMFGKFRNSDRDCRDTIYNTPISVTESEEEPRDESKDCYYTR